MYDKCYQHGLTKSEMWDAYNDYIQTKKFDENEYKYCQFVHDCKFKTFEKFLDDNIDDYEKVYSKVENYYQLIATNIAFLKSKLPRTWYYGERWGSPEAEDHADVATNNLIKLHEYGVMTVNGQSSFCEKNVYIPPWQRIDEKTGEIRKGGDIHDYSSSQRSYVVCYIPVSMAETLLPYLLLDKRIYVSMHWPDAIRQVDNVDTYYHKGKFIFDLTTEQIGNNPPESYTKWRRMHRDEYNTIVYEDSPDFEKNIYKIYSKLMYVTVINREFCQEPTSDQILLNNLEKHFEIDNFPNVYITKNIPS